MRFTVVWTATAIGQLANLWMSASDKNAVAESSNRIDRELRDDADKKGEFFEPFNVYYDDPLSVLFAVDEGDRKVRVVQVRRNKY